MFILAVLIALALLVVLAAPIPGALALVDPYIEAYHRGSAVEAIATSGGCGLQVEVSPLKNEFQAYAGVSAPLARFPPISPSFYPVALTFTGASAKVPLAWAVTYTQNCGAFVPIPVDGETDSSAGDFGTQCSGVALPAPVVDYNVYNLTLAPTLPPPGASTLNLLALNLPPNSAALVGGLVLWFSDSTSITLTNWGYAQAPTLGISACQCASCC